MPDQAVLATSTPACDAMERTRELRLRTTQTDTMVAGRVFERLDQYHKGVPVFGGEAVRETDGVTTRSVTASLYDGRRHRHDAEPVGTPPRQPSSRPSPAPRPARASTRSS